MRKSKFWFRLSAFVVAMAVVFGFVYSAMIFGNMAVSPTVHANAQTSARAMCTVEVSTGRVLYTKNAEAQLPMASTTKIVTAIAVIENCEDLDTAFEIDPRAVGIEGTSIYLQKGEKLTARELLLGLMLRSGNDASAALALHVAPADEKTPKNQIFDGFSAKMLEVAQKAGATNSNFKNPHGLDQEGHYTTARDLALITAYAMRNPTFAEIVATKDAKISGVEYPRVMANKNRLLRTMDDCVGVKTGFTKKAGRCYVGATTQNNMTVVSVVLNCGPMFEEAAALMDLAHKEFTMQRVLTKDEFINCDDEEEWSGIARENYFFPLREGEEVEIKTKDKKVCVYFENELIYCTEYNILDK